MISRTLTPLLVFIDPGPVSLGSAVPWPARHCGHRRNGARSPAASFTTARPPCRRPSKSTRTRVVGKNPLVDESLEVGPDGRTEERPRLAPHRKGRRSPPNMKHTAKDDVVVDNKGCRFEPHVSILQVGQTLVIKNSDTVGHNTKADALKNTPFNDMIPAGKKSTKPGTRPRPCRSKLAAASTPGWVATFSSVESLCGRDRRRWQIHHQGSAGRQGTRIPALAGEGRAF